MLLASSVTDEASDYLTSGFMIAAASAFFNGSFPAWSKATNEEVDPVVFNGLVGLGACISSVAVPAMFGQFEGYVFVPLGFVGGMLLIGATLCSFLAIPRLGLGAAMATWSCAAILVSFMWGAVGPEGIRATIPNVPFSVLSLILLIFGAVVIVSAEAIARKFFGQADPEPTTPVPMPDNVVVDRETENVSFTNEPEKPMSPMAPMDIEGAASESQEDAGGGSKVAGLVFALGVGVFGGSILVPMKFVDAPGSAGSMYTVFSFGLGAVTAAIIVTLGYWKLSGKPGLPKVNMRTVLIGVLSGTTWNAGNVCQIIAQNPPIELPYGIAYPINQCGMLFGGLWGIFVFGEIKGKAVLVFWFGALLLIGGVVLLGFYGPGA